MPTKIKLECAIALCAAAYCATHDQNGWAIAFTIIALVLH